MINFSQELQRRRSAQAPVDFGQALQGLRGPTPAAADPLTPTGRYLARQAQYLIRPQTREISGFPTRLPGAVGFLAEDLPKAIAEGYFTTGGAFGGKIAEQAAAQVGRLARLRFGRRAPDAYRFVRALEERKRPPLQALDPPSAIAAQQAVVGAEPQSLGTLRLFRDRQTILNRALGGGWGNRLAEAGQTEREILAPRTVDIRRSGLMRLAPGEDLNLFQTLEGRAQPANSRVARLAEFLRGIFDEDAAEYTQRGAQVRSRIPVRTKSGAIVRITQDRAFKPITQYAPRMLDPRRVVRMDEKVLAQAIRVANPDLLPDRAVEVAQILRARALGRSMPLGVSDDAIQLVERASFLPGHLHARTGLVLPDAVVRPMREAVPIYIEQAARERAFLRTFGPEADTTIAQTIDRLGQGNTDAQLAKEVWDAYRGRLIDPPSRQDIRQVAHILNNTAAAVLLGPQTAVSQVSQFGALVGKLGARNVTRGMVKVMFQGGRLEAERAGAYIDSLINELSLFTRLSATARPLDIAEAASAKFAGAVVKWSGIKAMDQFPRAVGYHAARAAIQDAQRTALLGNQRAGTLLREVGLSADATAEIVARKAVELSRTLNVTADFASLPHILQTPIGEFARGLNTFNIQVTRMITEQFVGPALRWARTKGTQGSVQPLTRFLVSSLALGEGIAETRRWLANRSGDRPGGTIGEFVSDVFTGRVPPGVVIRRAVDTLGWSGTLGVFQNVYQSIQFAMSGTEMGARLVSTATGAGVSNLAEVVGGISEIGRGLVAEEEIRRRRLRTGGRILTRRLPVGGGILGPRLFRSATADRRVAVAEAARALMRGDQERAMRAIETFERRHQGQSISQQALDAAVQKLARR